MSRREPPSQEAFDKLLAWLDPDREKAGEIYTRIQIRLIGIFAAKGAPDADDLADEVINVVASKMDGNLVEGYVGDPALYFYGVARQIYRWKDNKQQPPIPPSLNCDQSEIEKSSYCLDRCLDGLPFEERELIIGYHQGEKQAKIQNRKQLADRLGRTRNALRIQVHHIHGNLRECIDKCLSALQAKK